MRIYDIPKMPTHSIAERMGDLATEDDALALVNLVLSKYDADDATEIDDRLWLQLIDESQIKDTKPMQLISKNSGLTMWAGKASSKADAVQKLHDDMGIDPNGKGLDVIAENFIFTDDPESTN